MTSQERFTILIVDDERSNITALSNILRPKYVVLAAKDGPSALEVAQSSHPDIILLDILMPGMTGFEVLAELKGSDITRSMPVIIITGLDSAQDEETGLRLGAVDYITKPFRNTIVTLRVETHQKIVEQMRIIERLGMIDALTDIPNRRNFDNQLEVEWNRAVREQWPLGILMIDVDHFKVFNDTFGHAAGDVALKTVASVINRTLKRWADLAFRWGGEEFAVLLPNTDVKGTYIIAEEIRCNIEKAVVVCSEGIKTKVTVSIGVNTQVPTQSSLAADFIQAADQALYAAKSTGRNNVQVYT